MDAAIFQERQDKESDEGYGCEGGRGRQICNRCCEKLSKLRFYALTLGGEGEGRVNDDSLVPAEGT